MITTKCPRCGVSMRVEDKYIGKRGRCNKCGEVFAVPASAPQLAAAPSPFGGANALAQGSPAAADLFATAALPIVPEQGKPRVAAENDEANPFAGSFAQPEAGEAASDSMAFFFRPNGSPAPHPSKAPPPPSPAPPAASRPAPEPARPAPPSWAFNPFAPESSVSDGAEPPPVGAPLSPPTSQPSEPPSAPALERPVDNPFFSWAPDQAAAEENDFETQNFISLPPIPMPTPSGHVPAAAPAAMTPFTPLTGEADTSAEAQFTNVVEKPVEAAPTPLATADPVKEAPADAAQRVEILLPPPRTPPEKQKIEMVEVFIARLPCKETLAVSSGVMMKTGKMTSRVLVKIVGAHGDAIGWGEANPQTLLNGESLESVVAAVRRYLRPVLEGVAVGDLDNVIRRLDKAIPDVPGAPTLAKAAAEAAAYDLWARTLEIPLHLLLGGKRTGKIPLAYTLTAEGTETAQQQVKKGRELGYTAFQLRLVGGKEAKDRTALEAAAKAIPAGGVWSVAVDAGYPLDVAQRIANAAGKAGAAYLRRPLRGGRLASHRRLAGLGAAAIGVDEPIGSSSDLLEFVRADAVDVAVLQPTRYGIRQTIRTAAVAEAAGIRCAGSLQWESELGLAHAVQLFAAVGLDFPLEGAGRQFIDSPFIHEPLKLRDGALVLPDAVGCGVLVTEDELRSAAVDQ